MNIEPKEVDFRSVAKAKNIAEDLFDEFGNAETAVTCAMTVLALIGRKMYAREEHYVRFVAIVANSLMAAPKDSPL